MNRNCRGTVFCIGVGPGDPELMTLKAVRMIKECDVIAAAGKRIGDSAAYQIAASAVKEIGEKPAISIEMPMTRNPELLKEAHRTGAARIMEDLDKGLNVGYLILGDPSIYGSFTYLHRILKEHGYDVEFCSGVPSFCASAARLGIPLAEGEEELRIVPFTERAIRQMGCEEDHGVQRVIMKTGPGIAELKEYLKKTGNKVYFVEKCGREGERVSRSADEIPGDAGYMSLVIVK